MSTYLQVPTRIGLDGAQDKAAIIMAHASWVAGTNRDFLNTVRETVKDSKSADDQAKKWFEFCESRTYSREFGDVFAHPNDTAKHGGDCDDTTILLLAGLLSIGIPAVPDVIMRNGNGVHVRVRYGLPPHNPPEDMTQWKVLDPTRKSELAWVDQKASLYEPETKSQQYGKYGEQNQIVNVSGLAATGINGVAEVENNDIKYGMTALAVLLGLALGGLYVSARFR